MTRLLLVAAALVAVLAAAGAGAAVGTAPEAEWNVTFGGTNNDCAYSVQQTSDGGYILAGSTSSFGSGGTDGWLIKTDANGNQQWNKTFGGASSDYIGSVQLTLDGGYILAGYTVSYGAGSVDAWLIKTDNNGNKQWSKTFGGISEDYVWSVQLTSDGGYILAGWTKSYGVPSAWLIKTDDSGNQQWNKTFGGRYIWDYNYANSVQQTSDGGYILAGSTSSFGSGSQDVWLIKTDDSGNQQWNKTFGGTNRDGGYSVQQTSDGGYILAGFITKRYIADTWLIKTDANGNQQWNKTFRGSYADDEYAMFVQQTLDGGYALTGYACASYSDVTTAWLIKTDDNGNQQWIKKWGTNDEYARSVQQISDGGYVLAGYTASYGAGSYDVWLIKVSGEVIGSASFTHTPQNPIANQIITFDATSSTGNIATYTWNFYDGNCTTITSPTITHSYSKAGTYNVILTVTDDEGLTDSISANVTVGGGDPAHEVTLTLVGITEDTLPNHAMDVCISGNYVYVADLTNGLVIVDVSDPANPVTVGNHASRVYDRTAVAVGVAVSGGYAYVANWYDDLYVIEVADPTNPTLAATYDTGDGADKVTISGDYAYISSQWDGVDIVDISDPTNPGFVGNYDTDDLAEDVAISGSYAYIADRWDGVVIIDISDPVNPSFVGRCDTPVDANSIVVSGNHAYVADENNGLVVIDVADPADPAIVGHYDTDGSSWGVALSGNYVCVGDGDAGVVVLDVSDPTDPVFVSDYDTPGYAGRLERVGDLLYVADDRLVILRIDKADASLKGDLNHDNEITPADAAIALGLAATDAAHDDAADVSGDGCVTSLDALMILQAAAGRIEL